MFDVKWVIGLLIAMNIGALTWLKVDIDANSESITVLRENQAVILNRLTRIEDTLQQVLNRLNIISPIKAEADVE